MIDESSIKEAIIILEAEGRGIVKGAERPDSQKNIFIPHGSEVSVISSK